MKTMKAYRTFNPFCLIILSLWLALGAPILAGDSKSEAPAPAFSDGRGGVVVIPTVREIVENLDLKCYRIRDLNPSSDAVFLYLQHLNPVLIGRGWPDEFAVLQEAEQLCVPVAKNGRIPPPHVLRFIEWLDLKCYRIEGQPIDQSLMLTDLNPVLLQAGWGDVEVHVREPKQLCVPVAKDGAIPPPEALDLVQWVDLKTYAISSPSNILPLPLTLTHLNPVIRQRQWPEERVQIGSPEELMVPVAKNERIPLDEMLSYAQFIDLKCHPIEDRPINQIMTLTHLNPVLRELGLPDETVVVLDPVKLCVPVAKDGVYPE